MIFYFDEQGSADVILDGGEIDPAELGAVREVKRASHVEPEIEQGKIVWYADMAPVNGPKMGPYTNREAALTAERRYLDKLFSS